MAGRRAPFDSADGRLAGTGDHGGDDKEGDGEQAAEEGCLGASIGVLSRVCEDAGDFLSVWKNKRSCKGKSVKIDTEATPA
jgi:hypothetical protein